MSYTLSLFTTRAACLPAIEYGNGEVRRLTVRRDSLLLQRDNSVSASTTDQSRLNGLQSKITFLTAQIPALPDGKDKSEAETELRQAIDKRDNLLDPNLSTSPLSVVKRELELAYVQAQLTEATGFVTAMQNHHDSLTS